MAWWLWWIIWTTTFLLLAAWLWHKLESTRAMSWWDIHHEKEKAKRRKKLERVPRLLLILALFPPQLVLAILLLSILAVGTGLYFLLAIAMFSTIESLFAPKIKPVRPA